MKITNSGSTHVLHVMNRGCQHSLSRIFGISEDLVYNLEDSKLHSLVMLSYSLVTHSLVILSYSLGRHRLESDQGSSVCFSSEELEQIGVQTASISL